MVFACLNGARSRAEHPALPLTPAELAADARAVRAAGAAGVHLRPRDRKGRPTLDPGACDAAVAAIRRAAPRFAISLSTSAAIDRDPFARAAALSSWRQPPDSVSVNLSEPGWQGIARAAGHAGIAIEAGLATPGEADELFASSFGHQLLRVLIEVDAGPEQAAAVAARVPEGVAQLWHGTGAGTWAVCAAGVAAGADVRVGLEDVLTLPDGTPAPGNAALVAAAAALGGAAAA